MEGLHILSAGLIERTLERILTRWDASDEEQTAFRSWAWVVSSVCDTYASENLAACAELLGAERAALHRVIAERLHLVHSISQELVSKRAFLTFLLEQLHGPEHRAAA